MVVLVAQGHRVRLRVNQETAGVEAEIILVEQEVVVVMEAHLGEAVVAVVEELQQEGLEGLEPEEKLL